MKQLTAEAKQDILNNLYKYDVLINYDTSKTIENDKIVNESMKITEAICDEKSLTLGGCIATSFEIQLIDFTDSIVGKEISVSLFATTRVQLYPGNDLLPGLSLYPGSGNTTRRVQIFKGKVDKSEKEKNQKNVRKITAYDKFNLIDSEVYNYFSSVCGYSPKITLGTLKETLLEKIGLSSSYVGVNDNQQLSLNLVAFKKCCSDGKLSAMELLKSICELNCVFGKINDSGQFKEISLLNSQTENITFHRELDFEENPTAQITHIAVIYNNDLQTDVSISSTQDTLNVLWIKDNIILKSCTDVNIVNSIIYNMATSGGLMNTFISYTPLKLTQDSRIWLECGDRIQITTGDDDIPSVSSFVLSKTISGIQNLTDEITVKGQQYLSKSTKES